MSMTVRKKPQEETAMEKRNTAIINFILVALVPLLLMIFLGFSLKNGALQNEENLNQKFIELSKKHEALNQNIADLVSTFDSINSLVINLDKKDYDELVKQIAEIESEITLNRWNNDRDAIIDGFEHKINKVKDDRELKHDDDLQSLLILSAKWVTEIAKAKNDELSALKLIRDKELTLNASGTTADGTSLQELEMKILEKDFELKRLQDAKADNESDAEAANSSLQKKYEKVLEGNKTVKTEIETVLAEINEDIFPKLESGIFNKKELVKEIKAKVNKINLKTGSLKTDD